MFSFLGLIKAHQLKLEFSLEEEMKQTIAVVKLDPREGQPMLKQYDTNHEAVTNYNGAINTSVERGWEVDMGEQKLARWLKTSASTPILSLPWGMDH